MGKRTGRVYVVTPLAERFWPKVDKTSHPYGCWLWTGAKLALHKSLLGPGGQSG